MYEYITNGEIPPGATRVPGEDCDHTRIMLSDRRPNTSNHGNSRLLASERCLAIFRENGGDDMDFGDDTPKPTTIGHVRRIRDRISARFGRWWLWNVSYPARMWFHFRFNREKALPEGRSALCAMLRDAFAAEGLTDSSFPYAIVPSDAAAERDSEAHASDPGTYDLFFNRKRIVS